MHRFLLRALLLSGCLLLSACASYSGIAPQAKPLTAASISGSDPAASFAAWPRQDWWREFHDPALTALIEQALAGSPSLQAATAKLARARAVADQAESGLWPQFGTSLSLLRERFSERGEVPPPYAGTTRDINDLQFGGRWELDFFGKNREGLHQAIGELRATAAEHQAAQLMLASAVARSYFNLARLRAQRELAAQRQSQRSALAALIARRFKAGLDRRSDLDAIDGLVAEDVRDIALLEEMTDLARHALAALSGQGPDAVKDLAPTLPALSPLPLPPRLPAALLGHRADVVAARWRVEAAVHGLDASKALFYPNVNLLAFTGYSAIGFDHWLDAGSRQPGIGVAVNLPLFDAGRLRSLYRGNAAAVDGAVAAYNSTLLDALHDVADQLTILQALQAQLAGQEAVQGAAERSRDLALQRYQAGISDRLSALNMETALIAQRRASIELQARWIEGRIALLRALGGGFAEDAATALAASVDSTTTEN